MTAITSLIGQNRILSPCITTYAYVEALDIFNVGENRGA